MGKLLKNWDVAKYGMIPYPVSKSYWKGRLASASEDSLMLVITTKQDGVIIGYMCLRNPRERGDIHVRLKIGRPYQNQDYMTEALKSVSLYAFNELGARRLHAYAFNGNISSCKALENAGFRKEGVIRDPFTLRSTVYKSPDLAKHADYIVY